VASLAIGGIGLSCGSSQPAAPTAPSATLTVTTVPPTSTVTSIAVSGLTPSFGTVSRFTATATFTDGRTEDVTAGATWQSSDSRILDVLQNGSVSPLAAGEADVIAIYRTVTGRAHLTIPAARFTLSGTVRDSSSGGVLPNVRVEILNGSDAGKSATTNASGAYTIAAVGFGAITLSLSADGYQAASKLIVVAADTRTDFTLDRGLPGRGYLSFSTTATRGYSSIDVLIGGRVVGTIRQAGAAGGCLNAVPDARIVVPVSPGIITYSARTDLGITWAGSTTISDGGCHEVVLTCNSGDCGRLGALPAVARGPR
jgi:hypothetical protein